MISCNVAATSSKALYEGTIIMSTSAGSTPQYSTTPYPVSPIAPIPSKKTYVGQPVVYVAHKWLPFPSNEATKDLSLLSTKWVEVTMRYTGGESGSWVHV